MKILVNLLFLLPVLFVIDGCGGGGSQNVFNDDSVKKVSVAFSTSVVGAEIYGVQCKFNLPKGITLSTDVNGEIGDGVISIVGGMVGKTIANNYVKTTTSETVIISLVLDTAINSGEFMIVQFNVVEGAILKIDELTFLEFKVYDANGAVIQGVVGGVMIK